MGSPKINAINLELKGFVVFVVVVVVVVVVLFASPSQVWAPQQLRFHPSHPSNGETAFVNAFAGELPRHHTRDWPKPAVFARARTQFEKRSRRKSETAREEGGCFARFKEQEQEEAAEGEAEDDNDEPG